MDIVAWDLMSDNTTPSVAKRNVSEIATERRRILWNEKGQKTDPDLKVFIAVGGWAFNDPGATQNVFSDLAASEKNQKKFFHSVQSFMSTYNFDGIDLDWGYPVADDRGGKKRDFANFPKFLANLKRSLKTTGGRDGVSITEITNALDLLWRNGIQPNKVALGLAFNARVLTAADSNCREPRCLFVSGGNAGKCSREVGIWLNSEISDIMKKGNLASQLDKNAAVKTLKFDTNQWLTYDDEDTFKLKADFARSQYLGGVMGRAVGREVTSLINRRVDEDGDTSMEVQKTHPQCKWTNCGDDCPSAQDSTYFAALQAPILPNVDGVITIMVSAIPSVLLGTPKSLYSKYDWAGEFDQCTTKCPSDKSEIALSTTGSGDFFCGAQMAWMGTVLTGEMKRGYCCSEEDNVKWSQCEWRNDISPANLAKEVNVYCQPGCPNDYVRVSIDQSGGDCKGDGGRARGCLPKYVTIDKRSYTSSEDKLDQLVKGFMDDPSCGLDDYTMKGDLVSLEQYTGNSSFFDALHLSTIQRRATFKQREAMLEVLGGLVMSYKGNAAYEEIWNKRVYPRSGAIRANDPILDEGYGYDEPDNFLNTQIAVVTLPLTLVSGFDSSRGLRLNLSWDIDFGHLVEHVVELFTPIKFLRDVTLGRLHSSSPMSLGRISATFVRQALMAPVFNNPPVMPGSDQSIAPIERIMQALGSTRNRQDFKLLLKDLNGLKHRVCEYPVVLDE
ncbi:hypothetical protein POX_f08214 [Penicillium oxalicum]|uniref:hypothetical protein n=1 Tax=Penicillium oxalicum TaxID=69781 RepID=UPI0020B72F90|nr:hypothetical protein POX_f08214 [Penicillium oxalicum]KAI2787836.1 hypothetical protein POX_f08214 [Penicillium oxalicum]